MPKRPSKPSSNRLKAPPQPVQVPDKEKLEILNRHCLTGPGWTSLDEEQWCLHCCKTFTGRSIRVCRDPSFPDGYSIECGTPGCDGSPLDWHAPESDFAAGVTAQYAEADRKSLTDRELHEEEEAEDDPDYEDCGDYGPQIDITVEYRDQAQRQQFHSLLWQQVGAAKKIKVHPELAGLLCEAAKDALEKAFTRHFGAAWMKKWKMGFRARVNGWQDEPEEDTIHVEVESASGIDENRWTENEFRRVYDLTSQSATEDALLKNLEETLSMYLSIHASEELISTAEPLAICMAIIGYGGG